MDVHADRMMEFRPPDRGMVEEYVRRNPPKSPVEGYPVPEMVWVEKIGGNRVDIEFLETGEHERVRMEVLGYLDDLRKYTSSCPLDEPELALDFPESGEYIAEPVLPSFIVNKKVMLRPVRRLLTRNPVDVKARYGSVEAGGSVTYTRNHVTHSAMVYELSSLKGTPMVICNRYPLIWSAGTKGTADRVRGLAFGVLSHQLEKWTTTRVVNRLEQYSEGNRPGAGDARQRLVELENECVSDSKLLANALAMAWAAESLGIGWDDVTSLNMRPDMEIRRAANTIMSAGAQWVLELYASGEWNKQILLE